MESEPSQKAGRTEQNRGGAKDTGQYEGRRRIGLGEGAANRLVGLE